ncbi:hypothetical protein BD769DRAFT_1389714 [Suillus cothurnatus]|nr:hypothetical protein BD769DRAFT_1389714 [Suillus cothurnatus]
MSLSIDGELHGLDHEYYIYDVRNDVVLPSSGEPTKSVDFAGYLSVGLLPTVYALYSAVEDYHILRQQLYLPFLKAVSCNNDMHGLYNYVNDTSVNGRTFVHLARYPVGYRKVLDTDLAELSDIYTVSGQEAPTIAQSWIGSESTHINSAGPSNAIGLYQQAAIPATPKAKHTVDHCLHKIMSACVQWRQSLAYLRVLMRIAVCSGATENPHTLVTQRAQRQQVIDELWTLSLARSQVDPLTLESVLSKSTRRPISESEILALFLYDVRRTMGYILDDSRVGLGLGDGMFGDVARDNILDALGMFLRPSAHVLPLSENRFYRFLGHQMMKEIIYHVIFRTTNTCGVRLTIADLEPAMFRHAEHPPWETAAFLGSSCYQVLIQRLAKISGNSASVAGYPPPSQIFMELKETGPMLFQQHHDPDIQPFRQSLRSLCLITETDVRRISRPRNQPSRAPLSYNECISPPKFGITVYCVFLLSLPQSHNVQHTRETVPTTYFLGVEQTEAALLVWLQTQGRDILPESLVITASVVFGLVDAHDLIALIDMCLKEVAMYTQLQREEGSCVVFLSREGRCLMQDRMYRAQMEVSLFSNAIANLCDELQNRNHSSGRRKPVTVDVVECAEACLARNSDCVNRFQPTQATQDKCNAWLLTSSHVQGIMQVDPDTIRALLDSPKMDFPDLPESLLRPDDLLSLPRLLKTWVDNVTYRAYMNASFGERRAPRIVDSKDFQTKDHKSEEILKSDVRVLDLKKRRAQAEVDMFSEAMERLSELEATSDGRSSEIVMLDTYPPDNYLDDFVSASSLFFSSNDSVLL